MSRLTWSSRDETSLGEAVQQRTGIGAQPTPRRYDWPARREGERSKFTDRPASAKRATPRGRRRPLRRPRAFCEDRACPRQDRVAERLAFMGIRDTASLLWPAAHGAVRLLMQKALATPRCVFIRAGVAALATGMGASTLLLQIERHPTSLLAPVTHDHFPASGNTAAPAATVQPVASHASSTPISQFSTASAAARPAAAGESRATRASAPDITSSIERATQDKRHQSLAPKANHGPPRSGPTRSALSCATSPSTADRIWCALRRLRSRSSDTRSNQTVPRTAPPGALFAILSARTGWPRQLKSARNSSNNLWRRREVNAEAGRTRPVDEPDCAHHLVVAAKVPARHCG